jgi:hypothetical protein
LIPGISSNVESDSWGHSFENLVESLKKERGTNRCISDPVSHTFKQMETTVLIKWLTVKEDFNIQAT